MARFPFSKGRKKAPPQLILTDEPMTKAHKILGSTPINIDSPQPLDDASSGFSTGTADSILTSRTSTETDPSDHHVAIASLGEECTDDPDFLPAILESSALDSDNDLGFSHPSPSPRKTLPSSTIATWHDKPQKPSSIAQQMSPISMTKGMPPKINKMLDLESNHLNNPPKKPSRSTYRMLRRGFGNHSCRDEAIVYEPNSAIKTPSAISLITPTGKHSRKLKKSNTNDSMLSLDLQQLPDACKGRRWASPCKEIPSLYDHYEQMTLWHLMQEEEQDGQIEEIMQAESTKGMEKTASKPSKDSGTAQDLLWSRGPLPTTPPPLQTDLTTGLAHIPSQASPNSNQDQPMVDLRRLDLQKTSMLMLSSDSEDEEKQETATLPRRRQINNPGRRPSKANQSPKTVSSERTPSQGPSHGSLRSSKRTSFASSNTYITIPNSNRLTTDTAIPIGIDSRPSTSHGTDRASCTTSLMSCGSSFSAFQHSSNYIQEARAITMMAGRRPFCVQYGDEHKPNSPSYTASLASSSPGRSNCASIPSEQLTPPLSPTSVDFYIRSARSSIDGPGSHNRYMAVTRQEEMLLSAWRNKKCLQKEKPVSVSAESSQQPREDDLNIIREEEPDSHQDRSSSVAEGLFDFGFPVPPTSRKQSFVRSAMAASSSTSSRISTATDKTVSSSSIHQNHSGALGLHRHSPSAHPRLKSILKKPKLEEEETEQEQVILCLNHCRQPITPTQHAELAETSLEDGGGFDYDDMEEEAGIPRPDSPVSPDAFPVVPRFRNTLRTPLNTKARLSAVGSSSLMSGPA